MAINMQVVVTSGTAAIQVPDDVAKDLEEAWTAFKSMPKNRSLQTDPFETPAEANLFARQGRAWCAEQEPALEFTRRRDLEDDAHLSVVFRIHKPNPRGPMTEEQKAARQAKIDATRAAKAAVEA